MNQDADFVPELTREEYEEIVSKVDVCAKLMFSCCADVPCKRCMLSMRSMEEKILLLAAHLKGDTDD